MEHRSVDCSPDWLETPTTTVFTDLEKIFDECDTNCLGEVEICPLVDKICSMLPAVENQVELKDQFCQLLSSGEERTLVKRHEFEECMLKLIEKASASNLCSNNWMDSVSSECFLKDKHITSTPIQVPRTCDEKCFDHCVEVSDDEHFIYTSKSESISSQIKYNEEILILSQRNAKLEMTVADLRNQISLQENSPCKCCRSMQSEIKRLKNIHSELLEANKHNDELLEELVGCKEERALLNHKISIHKKKCSERENEVIELQKQMSELQESLDKKQMTVDSLKEFILNLQQNEIEAQEMLKYFELKLDTTETENENLKKDIKNMLEHISLERKALQVSEVEEDTNFSVPKNNLMQELGNEVSWYGFKDDFTQTTATLHNSLGVQIAPNMEHKKNQMSIEILNKEIQTDPPKLHDVYCETEVVINPDDFHAADETERNFLQIQEIMVEQKKSEKRVGWMYLCRCFIIVSLITAIIYIISNCQTEMLKSFNIKLVYLKPPPV